MTPEILMAIGGGIVVVNAATHIGVEIIKDRLLNGNGSKKKNGYCSQHEELISTVKQLAEFYKSEQKEEQLERVMEKALTKIFDKNI